MEEGKGGGGREKGGVRVRAEVSVVRDRYMVVVVAGSPWYFQCWRSLTTGNRGPRHNADPGPANRKAQPPGGRCAIGGGRPPPQRPGLLP